MSRGTDSLVQKEDLEKAPRHVVRHPLNPKSELSMRDGRRGFMVDVEAIEEITRPQSD